MQKKSYNFFANLGSWCDYEFKTAHYETIQDQTNRIIIILIQDKIPDNLNAELKMYIKTKTYLNWNDPWFREKLKYAMPDVTRDRVKEKIFLHPFFHIPVDLFDQLPENQSIV